MTLGIPRAALRGHPNAVMADLVQVIQRRRETSSEKHPQGKHTPKTSETEGKEPLSTGLTLGLNTQDIPFFQWSNKGGPRIYLPVGSRKKPLNFN